jgi:hypothetical protein
MHSSPQTAKDAARSERAIASLSERAGMAPSRVRSLFAAEFARLHRDAKVRKYLHVLATSNVQAMLRRAATLTD